MQRQISSLRYEDLSLQDKPNQKDRLLLNQYQQSKHCQENGSNQQEAIILTENQHLNMNKNRIPMRQVPSCNSLLNKQHTSLVRSHSQILVGGKSMVEQSTNDKANYFQKLEQLKHIEKLEKSSFQDANQNLNNKENMEFLREIHSNQQHIHKQNFFQNSQDNQRNYQGLEKNKDSDHNYKQNRSIPQDTLTKRHESSTSRSLLRKEFNGKDNNKYESQSKEIEQVIKELDCRCGTRYELRQFLMEQAKKEEQIIKERDSAREKASILKEQVNDLMKEKKLLEMQLNYEGFIGQINLKIEEKEAYLLQLSKEVKAKEQYLKASDFIQRNNIENGFFKDKIKVQELETANQVLREKVQSLEQKLAGYSFQADNSNSWKQGLYQRNQLETESLNKGDVCSCSSRQELEKLKAISNEESINLQRERAQLGMKAEELATKKAILESEERLFRQREGELSNLVSQRQQFQLEKQNFEDEKASFQKETEMIERELAKKEEEIMQLKMFASTEMNTMPFISPNKASFLQLHNPSSLTSTSTQPLNLTTNLNNILNQVLQNNNNNINNENNQQEQYLGEEEEMELKLSALKLNEEIISKKIEMQVQAMVKQKEKLDKREKELKRLEEKINAAQYGAQPFQAPSVQRNLSKKNL